MVTAAVALMTDKLSDRLSWLPWGAAMPRSEKLLRMCGGIRGRPLMTCCTRLPSRPEDRSRFYRKEHGM